MSPIRRRQKFRPSSKRVSANVKVLPLTAPLNEPCRRPGAPGRLLGFSPAVARPRVGLAGGFGPIAQRLEQATHNRLVTGSNPVGPTIPCPAAGRQSERGPPGRRDFPAPSARVSPSRDYLLGPIDGLFRRRLRCVRDRSVPAGVGAPASPLARPGRGNASRSRPRCLTPAIEPFFPP